jgi:DNA-binding MarR family transcriptional regulator
MNGMTDEDHAGEDYYDVWLDMLGRTSRPRFRALLLSQAGVPLDPDLAPYLVNIDLRGPIGVLDLAELVEQNHPKVSRTLARLEQLGLIRREDAEHDRRIKTASVTPEGHRVVEAINQGRRRLLEQAFAGWSDSDRATLTRLTRRFSDRVFALTQALDPAPDQDGDRAP